MKPLRHAGSQLILLILALLGTGDAIYLTLVHYNSQVELACPENAVFNCTRVTSSVYAYVPGTAVPISLPGLAWCLVAAALALAGLCLGARRLWLRLTQFAWTLLGLLTVLYLVYVEIVLLHSICLWCTVLHLLILLMFLLTLVQLPARPPVERWADAHMDALHTEVPAEPG
ncbi:MAG TPA: vitamin K epoxide reductase family protein [Ktedonobacteraceae bacterium]|jgi:uncharacterized membrane protein